MSEQIEDIKNNQTPGHRAASMPPSSRFDKMFQEMQKMTKHDPQNLEIIITPDGSVTVKRHKFIEQIAVGNSSLDQRLIQGFKHLLTESFRKYEEELEKRRRRRV